MQKGFSQKSAKKVSFLKVKGEEMVAYEFYFRDPIKGYQLIGTLPERRKSPLRITQESVMNWVIKILGENMNFNDIFFITITIDKDSGDIIRFEN
jgi:hypothetical protein